jgi:hypothetical protein
VAKHLAEFVLGLHDALHGSHADPPRGVEEVSFSTFIVVREVQEHTQDVLRHCRAAICWYPE